MADREISVVMESRYKSDLGKQLYKDEQRIRRFEERLKKSPLVIPVKLDLKGAMTQAAALRKAILGEFARIPSTILGADGRPATAPTSGGGQMNRKAGVLSTTEFQKYDEKEKRWVTEQIQQVEQLGKGISQLSKFKGDASEPFATVTKDISNVNDLRDALRGMNKELGEVYGKARGRGDKAGQIAALSEQRTRLNSALQQASAKGLENSPDYTRAEGQVSRIGERIASLQGGQDSAAEKQARKDRTRDVANQIAEEERRVQAALKGNKMEMDASERIKDRATREAEINRIYAERQKLFEESRNKFRDMDKALQGEGRSDLADRAMRRGLVMDNQANQVPLDRQRGETDRLREDDKQREKAAKEAQRKADQAKRLADAAAAKSGNRNFGRALRLDDNTTQLQLAQNKADEAAAKAIPDRSAREAELNRVLSERSRILQEQQTRLGNLQQTQAAAGNLDNAAKAEAAKLKAGQAAAGVGVQQSKADADAQIAAAKEAAAAQKAQEVKAHADRESAFTQEMQDIKSRSEKRIAQINANERKERAAAKTAEERSAASAKAHSLRVSEYGNLSGAYQGVETRARNAGHTTTADSARGKNLTAQTSAARDMEKFNASTLKSGHALNFHSSALLRNAATFARWMIPVQAVLAMTRAFNAGVQGAIKVDRQFATLKAVFRGTAEEAQRLKNETLDLAASQGRSTDEAMDSSIRWSRLGLTRIQVLEATRVSLMAANVAEISAAEAAEKLSGIYATYGLNVSDLAGVLNRLNSISNNYNVTVDDLFQGISRVSGVAKQSGLALRDLEGMIGSVVGAGGGTGSEVGNAIKFVISRLGDTKVGDKLKDAFDIDLTGPNGDLKDMSQIMAEMAALYPTLNKAQQQSFLQMAAGARQASRFAKAMTEYRQGQILAAKASFDHAASVRENENILQSLQSRIESLAAAWTSLFTAMGDAGAFDFVIDRLRGIQSLIDGIHSSGRKDRGSIQINNPGVAETVENIGGGWDTVFGTKSDFNEEEIMRAILQVNQALKERQQIVDRTGDSGANLTTGDRLKDAGDYANFDRVYDKDKVSAAPLSVSNPNTKLKWQTFGSMDDAKNFRQKLMDLLDSGGDTGTSDELTKITNEINILRDEVAGFPATAGIFDSLGEGFADGTVERETLIKQFQQISYLLTQLPGGQALYNDSLVTFNELLASGDKGKMRDFLKGLGAKNTDQGKVATENLRGKIAEGQSNLGQKLAALEGKKAALVAAPVTGGESALKEKEDAIKAIDSEIKSTTVTIEALNTAANKIDDILKSAFNPGQVSQINKYFEDLVAQAEAVGEAFKDFGMDTAKDPVERLFNRRRQSAGLALEWSKSTLAATEVRSAEVSEPARDRLNTAQNAVKEKTADLNYYSQRPHDYADKISKLKLEIDASKKMVEEQQKILDQQDESVERAKTQVREREAELEVIVRKLDYEERIAEIQRAATEGSRLADNSSQAWRFGETESDKDRNQAQMAIERAKSTLTLAAQRAGGTSPREKAAFSGQVMQDEATARAALENMERRQYEIDAARKQVAIDTVKAMREQTEEASKRLMLASREDQLRAAALARTIRDKGPVGTNEFFALSQETRQSMVNYLPNDAPDMLNDAKVNAAKTRQELDAEQGRITSTIGELRGALELLSKRITEVSKPGGSIDMVPTPPVVPVQDPANTPRDKSPLVNLQVGDVSVSIKLNEEIERIMTGYVDRVMVNGLREMERRFNRPPVPDAMGAVE